MLRKFKLCAGVLALALSVAACSQGSTVASPGATNPGTGGGGTGGGGGGGSGGGSATCPTGTSNQGALGANTICQLSGEILSNLSLPATSGVVYRISGRVDIGKDIGADGTAAGGAPVTLTIAPGATVYGTVAADLMIINRGSRITANGTVSQPIIFTSDKDILGQNDASISNRQWGGLIVLGRAPIRGCNTAVAAGGVTCQDEVEGVTNATGRVALYGGATPADNSGSLTYVQIRYPGAFLTSAAAGDDLNGLTLGGVGSGTVIDNVQVHNSGDDGIEVFGGTVNMKHIVLTGELDDSLDCDYGWTGNVQFLVIKQTAISGGPDGLLECSNAPKNSVGGTLLTRPTISNFTFVGVATSATGSALKGIGIDASAGLPGASGIFANGVVTGSTRCLSVVDPETGSGRGSANTTTPPTFNSILFDCLNQPTTVAASLITGGTNNTTNVANTLVAGLLPGPTETARASVNPTTLGSFFTAGSYIGAFGPTETTASNWASGWTIQLFPPAGCPTGTTRSGSLAGLPRCIIAGNYGAGGLPASLRLTAGSYYEISGRVDIGVDVGAAGTAGTGVAGTLTIDPGVKVFGNDAGDLVIINRGSTVFVNGTLNAPVIMTSEQDILRTTPNPSANREWGGFIILGRAPIRGCNTAVAPGGVTCQDEVEGVTNATGRVALYGGATPADNSGRVTFLQVRYAGAFLTSAAAGDDLNGITLGGIGSATTFDNIQVHNSGDDGIEIFGGVANLKHVIITGALDDSLDCDYGWTGGIQFLIVRQSALAGGPDGLMECSNAPKNGTGGATFTTRPTISNFTMIGVATSSSGAALKGIGIDSSAGAPGASAVMANGVVTGSTRCLSVVEPETGSGRGNANTTTPPTFNSILFNCLNQPTTTVITGSSISASSLIAGGTNNSTTTANSLALAASPSTALANFVNGPNETAVTPVDTTTLGSFFVAAPYVGAVRNSTDNWWRAWSCGLEAVTC
jgi:hypothetical protein